MRKKQYIEKFYKKEADVKRIIDRDIAYQNLLMVNAELLKTFEDPSVPPENRVYVFAAFMRPGKRTFAISIPKKEKKSYANKHWYVHDIIVPNREEDVAVYEKAANMSKTERNFFKPTSEFRDWREDEPEDPIESIEHDMELWNAERFIKDEEERRILEAEIKLFAGPIKNVFIQLASKSAYPQVGLLDFSNFATTVGITDQTFFSGIIDTYYTAAIFKSEATKIKGLDGKLLMRYNFLELLVRIAKGKFFDPGEAATMSEAFSMLMTDVILKNFVFEPWQEFRMNMLWSLDVDDVFVANREGIKKLFQHTYDTRKKYHTRANILGLFSKELKEAITEKEALYCFGMSKATVIKETSPRVHDTLEYAEFLEMIARIAEAKYRSVTTLSLAGKIECMLDELLPIVGTKRKVVRAEDMERSESDDDY